METGAEEREGSQETEKERNGPGNGVINQKVAQNMFMVQQLFSMLIFLLSVIM